MNLEIKNIINEDIKNNNFINMLIKKQEYEKMIQSKKYNNEIKKIIKNKKNYFLEILKKINDTHNIILQNINKKDQLFIMNNVI